MAALIPGKLLYLRSPHTASVATEQALVEGVDGAIRVVPGHCTFEEVVYGSPYSRDSGIGVNGLRTGEELVVTTIRNPYDVIVTWWLRAGRRLPFVEFIRGYDRRPQIIDGMMFGQSKNCGMVMRYESLKHDFAEMMKLVELPLVELPVENMTPGKDPWQSYYDDESMEAVAERFGEEIVALGYERLTNDPAQGT